MRQFILCILAVVASTASAVAAQPNERNASRERRIEESLGAISTSAVPTFRRATEAMDSGKYAEAEPLFREVLTSAPTFTPAIRRLGGVLVSLGRDVDGLALLNRAVQIDRSPENLISLAVGLAYRAGEKRGSPTEQQAALRLAKEAAGLNHDPEDESYDATVAQLALGG